MDFKSLFARPQCEVCIVVAVWEIMQDPLLHFFVRLLIRSLRQEQNSKLTLTKDILFLKKPSHINMNWLNNEF